MVIQERKLVTILELEKLRNESKSMDELMEKVHNLPVRKQKESTPEGGISLRQAEYKYGIRYQTIARWVKRGLIPILKETMNYTFVDENKLTEIIRIYLKNPGRGKRTVFNAGG